jgi:hypothetical protein
MIVRESDFRPSHRFVRFHRFSQLFVCEEISVIYAAGNLVIFFFYTFGLKC